MSVKTYNQLNDEDKQRARQAAKDRFLHYLYANGIPADPAVLPPEPPEPFTKHPNWLELNRAVQQIQMRGNALYWITDFLNDPDLSRELEVEIDLLVQDLRFRTQDTAPEDVLSI